MKKNSLKNHEIDIFELSKTVWDNRFKIFIILIISLLIGIGGNHYKKINKDILNLYSLSIKKSKDQELTDLKNLSDSLGSKITVTAILQKFIEEVMDFDEFLIASKDYIKPDESVSFSKILSIDLSNSYNDNLSTSSFLGYKLNFEWDNDSEAKQILVRTLDQSLENLRNSIFKELENNLALTAKNEKDQDLKKLVFLEEQRSIAKKLDIEEYSEFNNMPYSNSLFNKNLSKNVNDLTYLRGYKSIDIQINQIKKRKYSHLFKIENQIKNLKGKKIKLVDYNMNLVEKNSLIKSINLTKDLFIAISIGLLFSFIYVIIVFNLRV
tara:strand:- start:5592 stop:6563 length:972 start_codon:yes stop_codon:yes gene_type:complete